MANTAKSIGEQISVVDYMHALGQHARDAARVVSGIDSQVKNKALLATADAIRDAQSSLLQANQKDLQASKTAGLSAALLDRLELTTDRINSMVSGLQQIAQLSDPVGEISDMKYQPSGLQIGKMRVPIGVVGIIYESRPNVTADAAVQPCHC